MPFDLCTAFTIAFTICLAPLLALSPASNPPFALNPKGTTKGFAKGEVGRNRNKLVAEDPRSNQGSKPSSESESKRAGKGSNGKIQSCHERKKSGGEECHEESGGSKTRPQGTC